MHARLAASRRRRLPSSGIKDVGGATIVYRTKELRDAASWRYDGLLCEGKGDTGEHGAGRLRLRLRL